MNNKNLIIAIVLIALTAIALHVLNWYRGEIVFVEKRLRNLPLSIGEWEGAVHEFSQEVYDELREQDNLYRIYRDAKGNELGLYIGYYSTERGGHPEHIPAGCYTGAGFGVVEHSPYDISLTTGRVITVKNFFARKGEEEEQVLYWLQNYRGEVIASGLQQNIEKMKNKIMNRRNDGAFIRINTRVITTREETLDFQEAFVRALIPLLKDVWPVEEIIR